MLCVTCEVKFLKQSWSRGCGPRGSTPSIGSLPGNTCGQPHRDGSASWSGQHTTPSFAHKISQHGLGVRINTLCVKKTIQTSSTSSHHVKWHWGSGVWCLRWWHNRVLRKLAKHLEMSRATANTSPSNQTASVSFVRAGETQQKP